MRCIAIIEAQRPGLDSAIIWEDADRLVAFAYLGGRVKMTRPLDGANLDQAIAEVRDAFQINDAQLTRVHQWAIQDVATERLVAPVARRWG